MHVRKTSNLTTHTLRCQHNHHRSEAISDDLPVFHFRPFSSTQKTCILPFQPNFISLFARFQQWMDNRQHARNLMGCGESTGFSNKLHGFWDVVAEFYCTANGFIINSSHHKRDHSVHCDFMQTGKSGNFHLACTTKHSNKMTDNPYTKIILSASGLYSYRCHRAIFCYSIWVWLSRCCVSYF